jgi:hypothetical protein
MQIAKNFIFFLDKSKYRDTLLTSTEGTMKKKKTKTLKNRNLVAVAAFQRSGAGRHKDKRKESSRRACRKKVRP